MCAEHTLPVRPRGDAQSPSWPKRSPGSRDRRAFHSLNVLFFSQLEEEGVDGSKVPSFLPRDGGTDSLAQ